MRLVWFLSLSDARVLITSPATPIRWILEWITFHEWNLSAVELNRLSNSVSRTVEIHWNIEVRDGWGRARTSDDLHRGTDGWQFENVSWDDGTKFNVLRSNVRHKMHWLSLLAKASICFSLTPSTSEIFAREGIEQGKLTSFVRFFDSHTRTRSMLYNTLRLATVLFDATITRVYVAKVQERK